MLDSIPLKADQEARGWPRRRRHDPEALFESHFDAVYRYFARRVASPEDAQDLTAETFAATVGAKAPRKVEPLSWLYGIARRKLADHHRRAQKQAVLFLAPTDPIPAEDERAQMLRRLVDALPPDQREALLLQVLEELSILQIAGVMGRSQGSVKALIQRAKENVRSDGRLELKLEATL